MNSAVLSPLLSLVDIAHQFSIGGGVFKKAQALQAVRGISLDIRQGEVLAIVGESGCGKTTLAKILMHVIAPSSGEVLFQGQPLSSLSPAARAAHLQAIFQDPYSSLNPRKTVGEIIGLPLHVHQRMRPSERRAPVLELMERVGLPARFYGRYPNQLSGGQRQRVAIARALILKPTIVICDEPTSALDVSVQAQILNLLQDLQRDLGLTYVLISHNLAVVEHLATRVAVMYLGQIVELADTETLFREPKHPYTSALLQSVMTPDLGAGIPDVGLGLNYPNALEPPSGCAFHPRCPNATSRCATEAPPSVFTVGRQVACHFPSNARMAK
ncbi:MAG: ABC transporter ATP-binding protein [Litorivicinaceae bacterium]